MLSPSLRTQEEYVSLGGTAINCSGGITPWRTWLTCEETEDKAGVIGYTKDHGWIFEVHPYDNRRNADPFPLKDMGRFMHEAVAVDPHTGILYETEDAFSGAPLGSYYRFLPERAARRLRQPARRRDVAGLARAWPRGPVHGAGGRDDVHAASGGSTSPIPEATTTPDRAQDYPKPITHGQKLEGAWWGNADHSAYFVSSFARPEDGSADSHDGQVWRYDPRANTLTLELIFTGADATDDMYEKPDNMCVSPYGGLMICEDSSGENYMIGTTADG